MDKRYDYMIAVIIPCWNEEKLLPAMLDSLLAQTLQDWQAYCVDDCSTDTTAQVIRSYAERDSRIHYILRTTEPKGGQACRNIGLREARNAKYVCLFDADDTIAPFCFEQRVTYMEQHPEIDCGVFPMLAYTADIHEPDSPVYGIKSFDDDLEAMLYMFLPMAISTNTYRTSAMEKYGLDCDDKVIAMQDSDLSFRVILSGMPYAYAPDAKADYFYRVTNDGVAASITSKNKWQSHIRLMRKVAEAVERKYGDSYDRMLATYYALVIRKIGINRDALPSLMQLPWMQRHARFRRLTRLYEVMGIRKLWGLFFYPYRADVIKQKVVWKQQMAAKRKQLV